MYISVILWIFQRCLRQWQKNIRRKIGSQSRVETMHRFQANLGETKMNEISQSRWVVSRLRGSFIASWHVESRLTESRLARTRERTAQSWTFTFQPLRGRLFSSAPVNGAPPPTPATPPPSPLCEYGIDRVACTRGIIHLPAAEDLAPTRPLFPRPYRYIPRNLIATISCQNPFRRNRRGWRSMPGRLIEV